MLANETVAYKQHQCSLSLRSVSDCSGLKQLNNGSLHSLEPEVVGSQLGVIDHQVDATVDFGSFLDL